MVCRVDGPAIVQLTNGATGERVVNLVVDGAPLPLYMSERDVAVLFVLGRLEYEGLPQGVTLSAAKLTGEPLEPVCGEQP